jgi:hypothetical protein
MSILDIVRQYAEPNAGSAATSAGHFDQVAQQAAPDEIGKGVSGAFRSAQTPSFGEMVAHLFSNSNGPQQAGLLNELLSSVNPAMLSGIAGGALTRMFGAGTGAAVAPANQSVTPTQASQLTPDQVKEIAAHAERQDPSVIDRVGEFYGQHPDVVKSLGGVALALVLRKMAH